MKRLELVQRVRSLTRDLTNSIFIEDDIIAFINEGINRIKQAIPDLKSIPKLLTKDQEPYPLPEEYHHLLAVYSASRCFSQDERHYQSTTFMNEFEVKLEEFKQKLDSGDVVLKDGDGNDIGSYNSIDYVDLESYWGRKKNKLVGD